MKILAQDYIRINDTTAEGLYSYSPGICIADKGRIVVTSGSAGPAEKMEKLKIKGIRYGGLVQGRIYISDNSGNSFKKVGDFPFMHA